MTTSADIVTAFNLNNGVSPQEREATLKLIGESAPQAVTTLVDHYLAAMDQDRGGEWPSLKPPRPEIVSGSLPKTADATVQVMGIGGLFAYLNVWHWAHQHGGSACVVTNPHDIFTFSGWTIHPEEDMDQRLIEMFQTWPLLLNELRRLTGLAEDPESLRFKAFKIDYGAAFGLLAKAPREFLKIVQVALRYVAYEFTDRQHRHAETNLQRISATIAALERMGRVGMDPDKDVVNLCGRVVFEVTAEAPVAAKRRLKERYGMLGRELTADEVAATYGGQIGMIDEMRQGRIRAIFHRGGCFLAGHRENALRAMAEQGIVVHDQARVNTIIVDPESGRHAVLLTTGTGQELTVIADRLLLSLGGYGAGVISVDGISTLFWVRTAQAHYRLHPTGLGEGGTIHVVPVWTLEGNEAGARVYYHLGKATDGAIMGRDPRQPKSLAKDLGYLLHFEAHLRRIIPAGSTLMWLAATECGRPVCAEQHYAIRPLLAAAGPAPSFEATGGCGLGGNTAVIPEVQAQLRSPGSAHGAG